MLRHVHTCIADELVKAVEPIDDGEERMSQMDKQQVQEILTQLREEVKEMERTNWMYENVNEQVIKV